MSKNRFKNLIAKKHRQYVEQCRVNRSWPIDMTSGAVRERERKQKEAERAQSRKAAKNTKSGKPFKPGKKAGSKPQYKKR